MVRIWEVCDVFMVTSAQRERERARQHKSVLLWRSQLSNQYPGIIMYARMTSSSLILV